MTISERIAELKKELAELEAQELAEKEESRKKAAAEKDKEIESIKKTLTAFNKKYGDNIKLRRTVIQKYRDLFGDSEVIIDQEV